MHPIPETNPVDVTLMSEVFSWTETDHDLRVMLVKKSKMSDQY